jgi:LysM repeat protein
MNSSKLALTISAVVLVHVIGGAVILLQPGCKSDTAAPVTPAPAAGNSTAAADIATPLSEPTRPTTVTPATPVGMGSMTPSEPLTSGDVSPSATMPNPATSGPAVTYEVKKGDILGKIAKQEKVSLSALEAANNLTSTSKLKIGQTLTIPVESGSAAPASSGAAPAVTAAAPVGAGGTYTVKSGDVLSKIAHSHGVTVAALRAANHLSSDNLKAGQTLILPAGAAASTPAPASTSAAVSEPAPLATGDSSGVYVVKSGDSIDTIAKKHGVKASELMKLNNITNPKNLKIGQKLKMPTGATASTASAAPSTTTSPAPATTTAPTLPPSVTETATPPPTAPTAAPASNGTVQENVPVTPVAN